MDALLTYLRETATSRAAFAKMIGIDADALDRLIAGEVRLESAIARRMVDATGGALTMDELLVIEDRRGAIVDLRARVAASADEIDIETLTEILVGALAQLLGGARRKGDEQLPRLAAEAVATTYEALSTATTRYGADRLAQALRPVFSEILADLLAPPSFDERSERLAAEAAEQYFQRRPSPRLAG